jgi:hypothetical protein
MKKISNYHDLVAEKQRVVQRLDLLKRDVENEIHEIKEKYRPLTKIVGLFGNGDSSHNGSGNTKQSLLKMGGGLALDLLVGPRLAKAGLITRTVVPPLLRGIYNGVVNRFKKKK